MPDRLDPAKTESHEGPALQSVQNRPLGRCGAHFCCAMLQLHIVAGSKIVSVTKLPVLRFAVHPLYECRVISLQSVSVYRRRRVH